MSHLHRLITETIDDLVVTFTNFYVQELVSISFFGFRWAKRRRARLKFSNTNPKSSPSSTNTRARDLSRNDSNNRSDFFFGQIFEPSSAPKDFGPDSMKNVVDRFAESDPLVTLFCRSYNFCSSWWKKKFKVWRKRKKKRFKIYFYLICPQV